MAADDLTPHRLHRRVMSNLPRTHHIQAIRTAGGVTLAASVIALAAGLSACGYGTTTSTTSGTGRHSDPAAGSSTGAAADATIDPCSLLTGAELSDIIGSTVTVDGPAVEVARGRSCTYTFQENGIVGHGTVDITAWHGSQFFAPGTPGDGIGADARDQSDRGVVIFRDGAEVVQVHVLSPAHQKASLEIARAADRHVAIASRKT
jgi:hypothetical protein